MPTTKPRTFPSGGGRFESRSGKPVKVEGGTQDHPEGNRPRDKGGRPHGDKTPTPAAEPDAGDAPKPASDKAAD